MRIDIKKDKTKTTKYEDYIKLLYGPKRYTSTDFIKENFEEPLIKKSVTYRHYIKIFEKDMRSLLEINSYRMGSIKSSKNDESYLLGELTKYARDYLFSKKFIKGLVDCLNSDATNLFNHVKACPKWKYEYDKNSDTGRLVRDDNPLDFFSLFNF